MKIPSGGSSARVRVHRQTPPYRSTASVSCRMFVCEIVPRVPTATCSPDSVYESLKEGRVVSSLYSIDQLLEAYGFRPIYVRTMTTTSVF